MNLDELCEALDVTVLQNKLLKADGITKSWVGTVKNGEYELNAAGKTLLANYNAGEIVGLADVLNPQNRVVNDLAPTAAVEEDDAPEPDAPVITLDPPEVDDAPVEDDPPVGLDVTPTE